MKIKKNLFILFCVITFTACKKEYSVEDVQQSKPTPQPLSNTQVVTTGVAVDNNGLERASYWKDSNFFYVEPSATDATEAATSVMWNGQLIIAGQYWQNIYSYACYWVNGQRHVLTTDASNTHITVDAKVYNNILYILVKNNDVGATLHKLNNINGNGIDINLNLYTPLNINPSTIIDVTNMAFANNKLIIFGSYRNTIGNDEPCIWEIDPSGPIKHIPIPENNTTNFRILGGDATDNKTYIIGEVSPTTQNSAYIVWEKTGKYIDIQTQKALSSNAILWKRLSCKIDAKEDLYLLHTNPNPFNADLYTITPQKQAAHGNTTNNGTYGFGIDILKDKYAWGIGNLSTTDKYCGYIQQNNSKISLKKPNNIQAVYLKDVRIVNK